MGLPVNARPPGAQWNESMVSRHSNGKFAAQSLTATSTDENLSSWTEQGGSWGYPAYTTDAESTRQFWCERVEVPERVLKEVESAYATSRKNFYRNRGGAQQGQEMPPEIPRVAIRPVVRLAQMHWYAQEELDSEQAHELSDQTYFSIPRIGTRTPRDLVDEYRLDSIRYAFDESYSESNNDYLLTTVRDEVSALRQDYALNTLAE